MIQNDLKFFTNEPERDLYSRFAAILKSNTQFFDILVGYFRTSGFFKLYPAMEDVEKIRKNATFTVDRIHEIEQETRHDVVAFTRCVSESLGEEKKWVHYGVTSTDVVDTAYGLRYKKANAILREDIDNFMEILSWCMETNADATMELCGAVCFMDGETFANLDPADGEDGIAAVLDVLCSERALRFFTTLLRMNGIIRRL